ncbi:hypothetical protein ABZ858_28340 [Streptomyces sp. NPDC047017]|uniref:hypothetical protein n=1 Tax=Streptomyces sp. NPDC047017 TaxID=3155024 RepID=UPI0033E7CB76
MASSGIHPEATAGRTTTAIPEVPDFWFELPAGFTAFDLGEPSEARMLRMAEATELMFADATPEQRFGLVVSGEYVLQTMIAAGAEHVSSCFVRMPDDELSQGTLCVLVERPERGPGRQDRPGSARRTAAQWRAMHPEAEVGLVMLPYGMAALCIDDQNVRIPGAFFGLDTPIPTTVRQLQLCVPLEKGPGSVLFVFTTEDVAHWSEYLDLLSGIMRSISADEPRSEEEPGPHAPAAGGAEGRT